MDTLTWLLIREHVRSWRAMIEVVLVTLMVTTGFLLKGQPLGNMGAISMFTLLLVPVTTLRISRSAASMKCRYVLATGIGRTKYLAAVALSSFLIVSVLLAGVVLVAVLKSPDILRMDFAIRLFLLWVLIAVTLLMSMLFSRLLAGKWGLAALVSLMAITGLVTQGTFSIPAVQTAIGVVQFVLPWQKNAIDAIGSGSMGNWLATSGQLLAHILVLGIFINYVFQKRDLIFGED